MRELRHHERLLLDVSSIAAKTEEAPLGADGSGLRPGRAAFPSRIGGLGSREPAPVASARDQYWDHAKNALGIARLLVQDRRPDPLIDTACRAAIDSASRAALEQAGMRFEGDAERALARLAAPRDLLSALAPGTPAQRLESCERVIGWVAAYLRSEAPERSWGF